MDEAFSISQLAERDAPALMMTEKTGFASEMTIVSNKGLDALVDAFKFLNTMRLTADSMARKGGTLERLQSTIGVPAERKSHERFMKRLEEDIETCTSGGADLEKKLTSWRTEVEKFKTLVSKSNEQFINQSEGKDAEIARYGAEIESTTTLLLQAEEEGAEANLKYDESQMHQKRLIDDTKDIVWPSFQTEISKLLNGKTLLDLTYAMIRLGVSRHTSGAAAQDVKKTQEELERRRKSAETYKNQIADAEVELQKLTGQSRQLNDFSNALTPTLQALVALTDNLRALVLGFSAMEPLLKMLTSRQAETTSISQDSRDEAASLADVRDFTENARAMSAWALKIEHIAWLYASIIEKVLIGGLENVRSAVGGDGDGFTDTIDFFQAAQRQQLCLEGNGSSCNMIKSQVDAKYEQEKLAMETRHEAERAKFAKQARRQAEREARSGRLKFFSRR